MGMAAQITRYKPNYRKTFECVKVHPDDIDYCNIINTSVYISTELYVFLHEINHYL